MLSRDKVSIDVICFNLELVHQQFPGHPKNTLLHHDEVLPLHAYALVFEHRALVLVVEALVERVDSSLQGLQILVPVQGKQ